MYIINPLSGRVLAFAFGFALTLCFSEKVQSQCVEEVNPYSGDAVKYGSIYLEGRFHQLILAKVGSEIRLNYVNSIDNRASKLMPKENRFDLYLPKDTMSITIDKTSITAGGYSFSARLQQSDLVKLVNLREIRFLTDKGIQHYKLVGAKQRQINQILTCLD